MAMGEGRSWESPRRWTLFKGQKVKQTYFFLRTLKRQRGKKKAILWNSDHINVTSAAAQHFFPPFPFLVFFFCLTDMFTLTFFFFFFLHMIDILFQQQNVMHVPHGGSLRYITWKWIKSTLKNKKKGGGGKWFHSIGRKYCSYLWMGWRVQTFYWHAKIKI